MANGIIKSWLLWAWALVWAEVLWNWIVSSAIWATKDAISQVVSNYWPELSQAFALNVPFAAAAAPFALAWYAWYKWIEKWKEWWFIKWSFDGITKSSLIYGWVWTAATAIWAWMLAPFSVPVLAWWLAMYWAKQITTWLLIPTIKGTYYWIKWIGNKLNPFSAKSN